MRFCPRYPQVLPQFRSPAEVMRVAQREFFALDLGRGEADLLGGTDATLARLQLSQAELDGTLALAGSVVDTDEDRIYDGVGRRGSRVVTFARILKFNAFPLCAILNELFEACRRDVGFAVELEFAADTGPDPSRMPEFYFLQMRPLVASRERCDIASDSIPPAKLLCRSQRVLGNGRIDGLRDIVYVDSAHFDRGRSAEVASVVAEINERLTRERRHYVLLGPGRWGSFDPWIGIPVAWHQISGARVFVHHIAPPDFLGPRDCRGPCKGPADGAVARHSLLPQHDLGGHWLLLAGRVEREGVCPLGAARCAAGRGDCAGCPARPPHPASVGAHGRPDPAGGHRVTMICRSEMR